MRWLVMVSGRPGTSLRRSDTVRSLPSPRTSRTAVLITAFASCWAVGFLSAEFFFARSSNLVGDELGQHGVSLDSGQVSQDSELLSLGQTSGRRSSVSHSINLQSCGRSQPKFDLSVRGFPLYILILSHLEPFVKRFFRIFFGFHSA